LTIIQPRGRSSTTCAAPSIAISTMPPSPDSRPTTSSVWLMRQGFSWPKWLLPALDIGSRARSPSDHICSLEAGSLELPLSKWRPIWIAAAGNETKSVTTPPESSATQKPRNCCPRQQHSARLLRTGSRRITPRSARNNKAHGLSDRGHVAFSLC